MRNSLKSLIFVSLFFVCLSAAGARAQTAVNYRFVEVLDAEGGPVAGAEVEPVGAPGGRLKTDERGRVGDFPVYYGDYNTRGLKVSKPGYVTHEDPTVFLEHYGDLLRGEDPKYDPKGPVKIVLLKEPSTAAGRRAVEAELRRRALVRAAKWGDVAGVRRLLREGAEPDAADVHGVPAVVWAAAGPSAEAVRALLAAGADVRDKGRSGRRALLYYLYYHTRADYGTRGGPPDEETVRRLLEAGADPRAADADGHTALTWARQSGDDKIIKLVERAAARRK
ncbi:MAG TPA: hypothetical protein VF668_21390 [Pyrinomonadaceae bacterium]